MKIFHELLSQLAPGEPAAFERLAMIPLRPSPDRAPATPARTYQTLDEALRAQSAVVSEVSESGSVPELLFNNLGEEPVLLVEGEELAGAKQNRTLNLTLLAPARQQLAIPVSCVERGRWGTRGPGAKAASGGAAFQRSGSFHHARGRRGKVSSLNYAMHRDARTRRADQGEVWSEIDAKLERMSVRSSTSAASALYEQNRARLDDYLRAFAPQPQQCGAVFLVGADFAGLDLFAHADVFAQMFPKLLRSYALDALELEAPRDAGAFRPSEKTAHALLDALRDAETQAHPALGLGQDLRFESERVTGGALLHEARLLHLAAFRLDPHARAGGDPRTQQPSRAYRRASQRRAQRLSTRTRE